MKVYVFFPIYRTRFLMLQCRVRHEIDNNVLTYSDQSHRMIYYVRLVGQLACVHAVVRRRQAARVYGLVGTFGIQYETGHIARPRIGTIVLKPVSIQKAHI